MNWPSVIVFVLISFELNAQEFEGKDSLQEVKKFNITLYNKKLISGEIISDDNRTIIVRLRNNEFDSLKKSDIISIVLIEKSSQADQKITAVLDDPRTTRYNFGMNAFPSKKGEKFGVLNLYGPEFHFTVKNNFSVGFVTTWISSPISLALKYSFKRKVSKSNFCLQSRFGSSGFIYHFRGYGGLHLFTYTYGDRSNNISFSAGFCSYRTGFISDHVTLGNYTTKKYTYTTYMPGEKGLALTSAGNYKISSKFSFVFSVSALLMFSNEYISKIDYNYLTNLYTVDAREQQKVVEYLMVMPGLRFSTLNNNIYQFSLTSTTRFHGTYEKTYMFPMFSYLFTL
jgi:hypothetical protein